MNCGGKLQYIKTCGEYSSLNESYTPKHKTGFENMNHAAQSVVVIRFVEVRNELLSRKLWATTCPLNGKK